MAGDLQEIDPEAWHNIPVPVIDSIKAIVFSLRAFSEELAETRRELKTEVEQANFRTWKAQKDMLKELQEARDAMDGLRKHCREELHKGEESNNSTVRLAKEILLLVQSNEKRKIAEVAELRERLTSADAFMQEMQTALLAAMKSQDSDLNSKLAQQRQECKSELLTAVECALKSTRESISQVEQQLRDSRQQAHSEFRQWVLQHEYETNVRKKEASISVAEVKTQVERSFSEAQNQIRELKASLHDVGGEVYKRAKDDIEKLATRTQASFAEIERLRLELQETIVRLAKESANLREETQAHLKESGNAFISVRAEISSSQQCLQEQMESREQRLLAEIAAAITSLEARFASERDLKTEAQLKDIRAKLAWLPINLSDVAGMTPTEARLYTIEARQRTEENKHIHLSQTLQDEIDELKTQLQEVKKRDKAVRPSMEQLPGTDPLFVSPSTRLASIREQVSSRLPPLAPSADAAFDDPAAKSRSVSPIGSMARAPRSSIVLRMAKPRLDTSPLKPATLFSLPVSPPPGVFSRLSDHESVRFEKLIERT